MALRDKLRARVEPHLEPGEQIQTVFLCQTGPSPWFAGLAAVIVLFGARYYVVAATDRNYVVLNASRWVPSKPKDVYLRLPRTIRIGPLSGLWGGGSDFLGEKTHIHKRFHKDVEAADAAIGGQTVGYGVTAPAAAAATATATAGSPAAGWYADPDDATKQRWWDGTTWTDHRA